VAALTNLFPVTPYCAAGGSEPYSGGAGPGPLAAPVPHLWRTHQEALKCRRAQTGKGQGAKAEGAEEGAGGTKGGKGRVGRGARRGELRRRGPGKRGRLQGRRLRRLRRRGKGVRRGKGARGGKGRGAPAEAAPEDKDGTVKALACLGDEAVAEMKTRLCEPCCALFLEGQFCPPCLKVWRPTEAGDFLQCDGCDAWVHATCDNLSREAVEVRTGVPYFLSSHYNLGTAN